MTRHTSFYAVGLIAIAALTMTNARFLQTTTSSSTTPDKTPHPSNIPWNVTYSSSLGCGACIHGGYVYCVSGNEQQAAAAYPATANQVCC